jgi:hypothetical protein
MELKVEYIPISELKPYGRNARKHSEKDVEKIINSIKEFGFKDPVGIWGDKNTIVEGHGRVIAAKKLGMKEVPVIRLDDLTDEQRKAYGLAHNKTAELSEWDFDLVDAEIAEIENIDMEKFRFETAKEIEEEVEQIEEEPEVEFSEILGEENNYIILQFRNEVDWLQAQTVFDIQTVKAFSTRKDGKITKQMERKAVGRVLDGAKVLKKIMGDV